jgi:hypothetical protein
MMNMERKARKAREDRVFFAALADFAFKNL